MPNNEESFRLFPRGFLGSNIKPQVERTLNPFSDRTNKQQYIVNEHKTNTGPLIANPFVEGLYSDYIKNNVATSSFEFRKQILTTALSAFGTSSFLSWYLTQFKSPAAGDMHNRFLEDTLKFISTGVRSMSLEVWQSLLYITDEGDSVGPMTDYAKQFFGITDVNKLTNNNTNSQLVDVLQSWCTKNGGLEDLLGTLHILFGNVNT